MELIVFVEGTRKWRVFCVCWHFSESARCGIY